MPKGPSGQKRPADAIARAVAVMRIATGQDKEAQPGAKSAAAELGSKGGKARAETLSQKRRKEISKAAAAARWEKDKK